MDISNLEKIGLTKGESKIYLGLLETGSTTTGTIAKKTKLQKSAIYFCLESLIDKGLVTHITKNNIKYFEASSPKRLLDYLDKKENEIKDKKEKVKEILPDLFASMDIKEKQGLAKIFEGWNGMKSAFDIMLKELNSKDDYLIYSVCIDPIIEERFRRFIGKFHQKREAIKTPVKMIVSEELRESIGKDRENEKRTEVKYLPKGLTTPTAINIFGNKIILAIWTKEPSAILIDNQDVANSFRDYFKIMWNTAK